MSQENVEVFWRSCAAFDRGDYERALDAIDPEIEYDLTHFPEGRVYHGHDGIREAFRVWLGAFDEYRQDREIIATADDKLVVAITEHGRGKTSRAEVVRDTYALWNMRASKAVRITFFRTRDEALEAAGLSEEAMSQENVEIIRRGWEAWLRGDMDALVSDWDPDVIWDTSQFRDWPESNYYGVEGIRKFLREWLDVWGEYDIDVEEILAAPDGRVVSLFTHHGKGQQSGVPMELRMAQIATLRGGKVVRFVNYDDPNEALEAAGLSE